VVLASGWRPLQPGEAQVVTTPILTGADTWDSRQRRNETQGEPVAPGPPEQQEAELERRRGWWAEPIDATRYDPTTGNHLGHLPLEEGDGSEGQDEEEALAGDPPVDEGLGPKEGENGILKALWLLPRLGYRGGKKIMKNLEEAGAEARARRYAAQRSLAPNQVRVHGGGDGGVSVPPGKSAYFEWTWPSDPNPNPHLELLEHVGLRLDAFVPTGRRFLRIWLCAPSGTCSLMAQAPRPNDRHTNIPGNGWTFWTVRHWNEQPAYETDRTGHGPGTWSLRVTHTWPPDHEAASKVRDHRVHHPDEVDVLIRWWQVEFRGRPRSEVDTAP
jgi:hypothetical protein